MTGRLAELLPHRLLHRLAVAVRVVENVKRRINDSRVSTDVGRGEQLAIYPPAAKPRRAGHARRVSMTSHVVERD